MTDDHYIRINNSDGAGPIEHVILHGARVVMNDANEHDLWDQPPVLYAVTQGPMTIDDTHDLPEDMPAELREQILENGGLGQLLGFTPLDVNDQAWTTAPPAKVLSRLAKYARVHPPRLEEDLDDDQRIIGLLFMSEAWMVAAPDDPDLRETAQRGEVHKDPRRVEIRLVYGVDRAGYQYSIRHERGSDVPDVETIQGPGIEPTPGTERMSGEIPDALESLLGAITTEEVL